jgi:hypothetical protein
MKTAAGEVATLKAQRDALGAAAKAEQDPDARFALYQARNAVINRIQGLEKFQGNRRETTRPGLGLGVMTPPVF